jgi:hypothetical protein
MSRKRAPRAGNAPELAPLLRGQSTGEDGQEWGRAFVRLSTERVRHAALEPAQAAARGRQRSARRERGGGSRKGDEAGTGQTAAGVLRVPRPHVRGRRAPSRSH